MDAMGELCITYFHFVWPQLMNQISSSLNESLKPEPLTGEHIW